ncbi:unnamed protein product [Chondrus crispus]|uniref:Uncharacterized protein n=1 Tax=Chondrus crispus TaxID=2769 RepID=R7QDI3_CHOCR|nr:unnamed protein product [Chondrus crispus]CDF36572.1 unnamed protein product [Chondrus crispus]|eukprot:XP_005716391.1 unnamed protein product [Chondrus crispus]
MYATNASSFQAPTSSSYSNAPQSPPGEFRKPPPGYASGQPLYHPDCAPATQIYEEHTSASHYPYAHVGARPPGQAYLSGKPVNSHYVADPPKYTPSPDIYQASIPDDRYRRSLYTTGHTPGAQHSDICLTAYSDTSSQMTQPAISSRHSMPAYGMGGSNNLQQPYAAQPYPHAPQPNPQQLQHQSSLCNRIPPYDANNGLTRPASFRGPAQNASSSHKYGRKGTQYISGVYGSDPQAHDPRLATPCPNGPGVGLQHPGFAQRQPGYPPQGSPYADNGPRVHGVGPPQGYASPNGYAAHDQLQSMHGNPPLGNNMYNSTPQPPRYGPSVGGMVPLPGVGGMMPPPGVGGMMPPSGVGGMMPPSGVGGMMPPPGVGGMMMPPPGAGGMLQHNETMPCGGGLPGMGPVPPVPGMGVQTVGPEHGGAHPHRPPHSGPYGGGGPPPYRPGPSLAPTRHSVNGMAQPYPGL